jgi:ATP-dependent Clp protease ATP-binding subunit ClpA
VLDFLVSPRCTKFDEEPGCSVLSTLREFSKHKIEEVTGHEVAAVISNKTGIPIGKIQSQEKERLMNME